MQVNTKGPQVAVVGRLRCGVGGAGVPFPFEKQELVSLGLARTSKIKLAQFSMLCMRDKYGMLSFALFAIYIVQILFHVRRDCYESVRMRALRFM